eukprot:TRINITY_DN9522_c0_g1_i1.p1 TRINITY_DN9522_c0_g1~~TRINITY_DN9522_c0_g1_i1.p1  ORF type:complete len:104 (+),score=6.70 TRINITY_DN9522_c0_g1_i1:113-424(+)
MDELVVEVDKEKVERLITMMIVKTFSHSVEELLLLYSQLMTLIQKHSSSLNRNPLLKVIIIIIPLIIIYLCFYMLYIFFIYSIFRKLKECWTRLTSDEADNYL